MNTELIITNGDSAAKTIGAAGLGDEILPWRDVLHMGPVPHIGGLEDVSALRARYLASQGWANLEDAIEGFEARDALLKDNEKYDRLTLWFEHDLYDQLQLLQILDFMVANPRADRALYLLQANDYLGRMKPEDMPALGIKSIKVTDQQLHLAKAAWWAFSHDTPETWAQLLNEDIAALPYLRAAVVRMLEELPGKDGLSRTERHILRAIKEGVCEPRHIFGKCQQYEEAVFMGDDSFFRVVQNLALSMKPAVHGLGRSTFAMGQEEAERLRFLTRELRLTDFGREMLDGEADFAAHNEVDFWWGGTLVTNNDLWRWDCVESKLVAP